MKNKFIKYIVFTICFFCIFFILTKNQIINQNIIYSINLWGTKVFPSLFPMFIINEILIESDFPVFITNFIINITKKKIKINAYAIYVFIMSIFSGTPTNALIVKNLVTKNLITNKDAAYILSFTFFSNPLFLWNMLIMSFTKEVTLKIILFHYLTNIIIYLFFHKKLSYSAKIISIDNSTIKISKLLNFSIKKSLDTLLTILGTITFYIIISSILINFFNITKFIQPILKGFLELTQGLNSISTVNLPLKLKEIIAISIISFGGLSIHSQVTNIITEANISYKYFLFGRIIHVLISILLIIVF